MPRKREAPLTPEDDPTQRFQVTVSANSHYGWIRTRMAVERTLMAWLRTAGSLSAFGFTIVTFYIRLNDMAGVAPAARPQAPKELGLAMIAAGVLTLIVALYQNRKLIKYLWSGSFAEVASMDSLGPPNGS
jgi:putative membrane protein